MIRRLATIVTLSFFLAAVSAAWAAEPTDGWIKLFNGKDLTGWKVPEGDNGHWKVIDGVIDYDAMSEAKKDKNLWTEQSFGDFVLKLDWRLKETPGEYAMPDILPDGSLKLGDDGKPIITMRPNADSGIFLRGYGKSQINIWCWPIGSGEIWGYRNDKQMPAEVRAAAVPKEKADKPVGEWNTFEITLRGEMLDVVLNGKHVIKGMKLVGVPETGPVGLQHHGGINAKTGKHGGASSVVQFRNIMIKPLTK